MNLIKNVSGDWDTSKQKLRADLDEIQRNVNQILAQINAPVTPTPVPPPVISSANTVTTFGSTPLTSVAVKPRSHILGNGTILNPLDFNGVSVSVAGGLTGAGTAASPLAVNVDGVTVTINGSNQLVAASSLASDQTVFYVTGGFGIIPLGSTTPVIVEKLHSTPLTVISGVPNFIVVPVYMATHYISTGSGGFTATISPTLVYTNHTSTPILQVGELATNTVPRDVTNMAWAGSGGTISGATVVGQSVEVLSTVDCSHGNDVIYQGTYIVAYRLLAQP